MATILIVEDKDSLRSMLLDALRGLGHTGLGARSAEAGLEILKSKPRQIDLLLTDLKLPGMNGLTLLAAAHDLDPLMPVMVMTAFGTVPDAVAAIKRGAYDFLQKPVDLNELEVKVQEALALRNAPAESAIPEPSIPGRGDAPVIIGSSPALAACRQSVLSAAATEMPVLLLGESGTGKELFARLAHHASPRRGKPYIAINCAASPETLLENELFGHEKGAYTGADSSQPGRFERAQGGTIFLDEIGDMAPGLQSKLLRVIQEKNYERLGGVTRDADVRVIAATNIDMATAITDGRFRPDLYYRLAAFPVRLPPLRERLDDLDELARYFMPRLAAQHKRSPPSLTPGASLRLRRYRWPGNVRDFVHALERAMISGSGPLLKPDDFGFLVD